MKYRNIYFGVAAILAALGCACSSAQPASAGRNMLANASVEQIDYLNPTAPKGWTTQQAGHNQAQFIYSKDAHRGKKALRITMTSHSTGDAAWVASMQPVVGGQIYAFSDFYRSNVDSEVYAKIIMRDATEQWLYIGQAVRSQGWHKFYRQIDLPPQAAYMQVYHAIFAVGYLVTDDYVLAKYSPKGFEHGIVSLTFDDGLHSVYTNALPLLQQYGYKSTQYMLTGFEKDPYYMTPDMMRAFASMGHEIGSHGVSHRSLPNLPTGQQQKEVTESAATLQQWLGARPVAFASPHGSYNAKSQSVIRQSYSSHRTTDTGFNSRDNVARYAIKVKNVIRTTTSREVAGWLERARIERTWLVLVYHAVDEPQNVIDSTWSTTPSDLKAHLQAIQENGLQVMTVSRALKAIGDP